MAIDLNSLGTILQIDKSILRKEKVESDWIINIAATLLADSKEVSYLSFHKPEANIPDFHLKKLRKHVTICRGES